MAGKQAVLLRAINVGGRKLVMADFKAALEGLGYDEVRTLAAAGSAVVAGEVPDEGRLEAQLGQALGAVSDVFVRSGPELAAIVRGNPFAAMAKDDPSHLLVMFLRADPGPAAVETLRGKIVGRESVAAGPGCLYACYPDGIGRSKLTAAVIERALGTRGTGRNWNTVGKLAELTG